MDLGLRGKKVFVTGGSAGIGQAMVRTFAAEGADVAFTYLSGSAAAEELVAELEKAGSKGHAVRMDVRDHASVQAAVKNATTSLGQIDVLVNNALAPRKTLSSSDPLLRQWQLSLRANLESHFLATELVSPGMRERKWGRILSISSDLARKGSLGGEAYASAKAGLHGMTRALCWSLGPDNVLINVVMPGLTSSDNQVAAVPAEVFAQVASGNPTGRVSDPQDIADLVVFLCSARNRNITGEMISVTGGS